MVLGAVDDIKAQFAWQEAAEASNSTASGAGSPRPRGSRRECAPGVRRIYPSTLDTYRFPSPFTHVNTVTMSELIITSSACYINGDSPMTSVANTVAMTVTTSGLAVHTLQPHIFY